MRIEPPPITVINNEVEDKKSRNIIKIKIRRNPALAASKTYKLNMVMFNIFQPEDFLALLKNLIISIKGTRTTTVPRRINCLCMMLRGEALR